MDPNSSLSTFDFNSQAGVMSLLAAIRSSALGPAEKNELRDLVFLYTNGGGDVSIKIALEQKLIAHKIVPVPIKAKANDAPATVLPFGTSRPAPSFKAPKVVTGAAPVTPQPIPAAPAPTPAPAPVTPPPAPAPEPVPTPTPAPAPAPVQASAPQPVAAPVTPAPAPVAQPVPVATATTTSSGVDARYLDRIREIKTAVNSKVGNPVNLVDINNEVGREYMNALLDAMKRLSGGAGQIEPAMQRLETAFVAVEKAVAAHEAGAVSPSATPVPQPTPAPAPVPPPAPEPVSVPVPNEPVPPISAPAPEPVMPAQSAPVSVMSEPEPVALEAVPAPVEAEPEVLEEAIEKLASMAEGPSGFDAPTPAPVPPAAQHSVLNEQKVLTPQDLPAAASVASVVGDPLTTREIDDGLEQLLSDWSLFKKSGLFGTGPKGREHPLFKKIADLPIPLLLAGRFEGSTQEIKQSITDYMNGWRYEQGIIYEQGETFEHYLRRVIRQILDLQKKRRPS